MCPTLQAISEGSVPHAGVILQQLLAATAIASAASRGVGAWVCLLECLFPCESASSEAQVPLGLLQAGHPLRL